MAKCCIQYRKYLWRPKFLLQRDPMPLYDTSGFLCSIVVVFEQDLKKYLDGLARKGQHLSPQLVKVNICPSRWSVTFMLCFSWKLFPLSTSPVVVDIATRRLYLWHSAKGTRLVDAMHLYRRSRGFWHGIFSVDEMATTGYLRLLWLLIFSVRINHPCFATSSTIFFFAQNLTDRASMKWSIFHRSWRFKTASCFVLKSQR